MFVVDSIVVMITTGLEGINVGRILYCGICPKPFLLHEKQLTDKVKSIHVDRIEVGVSNSNGIWDKAFGDTLWESYSLVS